MTFVQICEFDWLSGRQKGSIFVKMFKNPLLRIHKGDEAENLAYMLRTLASTKVVFLFQSNKNSACYGNL